MSFETASLTPVVRVNSRLTYAHLRALDHALLHDNLSAARQAFASLQEDAPDLAEIVRASPHPADSPRRLLKQLAVALRHGQMAVAQQAFIQFQDAATVDSRHPFQAPAQPRPTPDRRTVSSAAGRIAQSRPCQHRPVKYSLTKAVPV